MTHPGSLGQYGSIAHSWGPSWSVEPQESGSGTLLLLCVGMFTPTLTPLTASLGVFVSITFHPCDNLPSILSSKVKKL